MSVRLYPPGGAGSVDVNDKELEEKLKASGWTNNPPLAPEPKQDEEVKTLKGGKFKQ